jgi:predicted transcriptional regulator with HTH domain
MADKTNSEALTIRATVQYLLESHPMSAVLALIGNALAYDPDNQKGRLLSRKVFRIYFNLIPLGQGNRAPQSRGKRAFRGTGLAKCYLKLYKND